MRIADVQRRGLGIVLALATAAVAATGGWRLNRSYPAEDAALAHSLPADAGAIIDARGPLAYANGHIPGARQLWSRDLLSYVGPIPGLLADAEAITVRLAEAGLTPEQEVIVYDQGRGDDAPLVALVLRAFGVEAQVLAGGYDGWLEGDRAPEEGGPPAASSARADWAFDDRLLVRTDDIPAHLAENLVAPIDVRSAAAYGTLHLEQAVNLPADVLAPGGALPRWSEMDRLLGRARITPDTHILLYGEHLAQTARAWVALKAFGRDHIHVVAGPFALLGALDLAMTRAPVGGAVSERIASLCWETAPVRR